MGALFALTASHAMSDCLRWGVTDARGEAIWCWGHRIVESCVEGVFVMMAAVSSILASIQGFGLEDLHCYCSDGKSQPRYQKG